MDESIQAIESNLNQGIVEQVRILENKMDNFQVI